jgi:hypothetical protein
MPKKPRLHRKLAEKYGMPEEHTFHDRNIDAVSDRGEFLEPSVYRLAGKLDEFSLTDLERLYLSEGSKAELIGEEGPDSDFERTLHYVEVLGVYEYRHETLPSRHLARIKYMREGDNIITHMEVERLRPLGYRKTKG